jgi:DivIVA domain-containing protein
MWLLAVVIVLVMGAVAVVATGSGDGLAPTYDDRPDVVVPEEGPLWAADLRSIRFTSALRGYRASEVDALLARLATQLGDKPAESGPDSEPDSGMMD